MKLGSTDYNEPLFVENCQVNPGKANKGRFIGDVIGAAEKEATDEGYKLLESKKVEEEKKDEAEGGQTT